MDPSCGEDIDLGFRAREHGFKIGIAGDVYIHHEGSRTFSLMMEDGTIDYAEIVARNDQQSCRQVG